MTEVVKDAYKGSKRIIFGGDNYAEEWHAEAEQRGLKNLRTTPEALPEVLSDAVRRRRSRSTRCSRTASSSRASRSGPSSTPRAPTSRRRRPPRSPARCCCRRRFATSPCSRRRAWTRSPPRPARSTGEFADAIGELEEANHYPDGIEGLDLAIYARDHQLTAIEKVRELGDRLEKVVADDLWPLPKYSEILFIK